MSHYTYHKGNYSPLEKHKEKQFVHKETSSQSFTQKVNNKNNKTFHQTIDWAKHCYDTYSNVNELN
jgi:hypothetical protein